MAGRPGLRHNRPYIFLFLIVIWGLSRKCKGLQHKPLCGVWPSAECCASAATVGDLEKLSIIYYVSFKKLGSILTTLLNKSLLQKVGENLSEVFFSQEFPSSGYVKREVLLLCWVSKKNITEINNALSRREATEGNSYVLHASLCLAFPPLGICGCNVQMFVGATWWWQSDCFACTLPWGKCGGVILSKWEMRSVWSCWAVLFGALFQSSGLAQLPVRFKARDEQLTAFLAAV